MSSDLAHEEYNRYFSNRDHLPSHPEDADDSHSEHLSEKEASHSRHPTYRVDDAEGSDDDSLHDYNIGNMSATATATYQLPTTLFDANTGPKGVIADAASYERAKKKSFRQTLYNIAQGTLRSSSKERSSSPEISGNEAETDEEFMRRWRENRLRELQNGAAGQRKASPSKRRYGTFDNVDANGYLDAVEKLPSDTIVVVCIYDPELFASSEVEKSLSTIAKRYPTTRFIKLHHEIAEMDHMGVPAILAYKGGDVFSTVMNIKESQREVDSLESVLLQNRMVA